MAKSVFRPGEITQTDEKVMLKLSHSFVPETIEEVVEEVVEYTGPTVEDLQKEAEDFKLEWETEKAKMLASASLEAEEIIRNAQESAFAEIKKKTDQAQVIQQEAETRAQEILLKKKKKALEIFSEAEKNRDKTLSEAYNEGYAKGSEQGFSDGKAEADRLIERLHTIVEKTMDKRQEILHETEQQIIELVLLISRKVIKVISDNQKSVVMSNIVHALRKVKGRGDVVIRVNIADLKLVSAHTKDFLQAVESIKNITVLEDTSVDKGGCIVETDFGAIDARISSQLSELEQKILEVSPIKTVAKSNNLIEE